MGWWRKSNRKRTLKRDRKRTLKREAMLLEDLIECCDGKSNPIKFFSADEIRKATDSFSESNHVSKLSDFDCKWYSGQNENHHKILIKKADNCIYLCHDIAISSMVSGHKNFLKLVGCCLESENPVMVYHGVKKHYKLDISVQTWKRRMKIAEDIATALAYLHTAFPRPFVYRSLSLANILLDEDGVAKLSAFSFCVSIPEGQTFVQVDSIVNNIVVGFAYMELNCEKNGVVSKETDVFAIGIVMLTLLTRKKRFDELRLASNMSEMNDSKKLNWLSKYKEKRRMEEIADPEMLRHMGKISEEELCQMKAFLMLSHRCIGLIGEVPTMVEVAKELKKIQRTLKNGSSSPQDISSSVLLSNQT